MCFKKLLWLLNCLKYKVILRHVHNIMMIPIPHNHQEGEEHAKRSSVSSSVIGLTERIVLNIVNGEVVCAHKGLSPTWMQCYVSYVVMLLPERQPWYKHFTIYFIRCEMKRELSVQEGAGKRIKAH